MSGHDINHAERAHAYLSCSSSDRWLNCTVAPSREEAFEDERSSFADEGTRAHELGENCLINNIDTEDVEGVEHGMAEYVQQYVDYVRDVAKGGTMMVEQKLDISRYVKECFGTADAVVINRDGLHIIDLKYGKGVRVDATDNPQGKLYALGAIEAYDFIYGPFKSVTIHIVQPRIGNFSRWETTQDALETWGQEVRPIADKAFAGEGEGHPGEHCKFCRARHTCRERAAAMIQAIGDKPAGDKLNDDELAALYPTLASVVSWANDLQAYCLKRVEDGNKLRGLKLVEGISRRKLTNKDEAIQRLSAAGFTAQEILNTDLKGFTDLEKLTGKKKLAELLGDLIIKPQGKPTLVSETDERPEIGNHDLAVEELLNSNV